MRSGGMSIVIIALLGAGLMPTSEALAADAGGTLFEDATSRLLDEEVFSDTPVEFALPSSLSELVRPAMPAGKTGRMSSESRAPSS